MDRSEWAPSAVLAAVIAGLLGLGFFVGAYGNAGVKCPHNHVSAAIAWVKPKLFSDPVAQQSYLTELGRCDFAMSQREISCVYECANERMLSTNKEPER